MEWNCSYPNDLIFENLCISAINNTEFFNKTLLNDTTLSNLVNEINLLPSTLLLVNYLGFFKNEKTFKIETISILTEHLFRVAFVVNIKVIVTYSNDDRRRLTSGGRINNFDIF